MGALALVVTGIRYFPGAYMKARILSILFRPEPLRIILARKIIKTFNLISYQDRVAIGAVDRPTYAYCIFQAAQLASLLKYPRISILEFGCGGGNGLVAAERHIAEAEKLFDVKLELYGFDMGYQLRSPKTTETFHIISKVGFIRWTLTQFNGN